MKKVILGCAILMAGCMLPQTLMAGNSKSPLSVVQLDLKLDYINFVDSVLDRSGVDRGVYLGVEGFYKVGMNCYVGMEIGWAEPDGSVTVGGNSFDTEFTFIPVELNTKYAIVAAPNFVFDIGGGLSYNYVDEEISRGGMKIYDDEWLFGGQLFLNANYYFDNMFVGANGKYQITEEVDNADYAYDNWRLGGHVGFNF